MQDKVKKYITALLFQRVSSLLKPKNVYRPKILVIKGLGKFVIGDLKTVKKYKRDFKAFNKKYTKKKLRAKTNTVPKKLDELL